MRLEIIRKLNAKTRTNVAMSKFEVIIIKVTN